MISLVGLLVLAAAALYFMSPEERVKLLKRAHRYLIAGVDSLRPTPSEDALNEILRARARWPIVTLVLLVAHIVVFVAMLVTPGSLSDPATLVGWGANALTRTGNGEWWRLASSSFVHAGPIHLFATIAALFSVGIVLERAVGSIAFAAVYVMSAIVASVVSLWTAELTAVTYGSSGAVFGVYGLLLATAIYGGLRQPRLPVPLVVLKRVGAGATIFVLYNVMTDYLGAASELAGLATGLFAGLVLATRVVQQKAPVGRASLVGVVTVAIALLFVVPLRGMIDARPALLRVASIEERTSSEYAAAVEKFKLGQISTKALALIIERNIIPALQADRTRVDALRGEPRDQAPLVAAARRYFELRLKSWRTRADGLRASKIPLLNEAERTERDALEALVIVMSAAPAE